MWFPFRCSHLILILLGPAGCNSKLRGSHLLANETALELDPFGISLTEDTALKRPWPRIKAYFVNLESSVERAKCMYAQLAKIEREVMSIGGSFQYDRLPAVTFSKCTTPEECVEERPECFPTKQTGYVQVHGARGAIGADAQHLLHGVFGNWCSHLIALNNMLAQKADYDFFMLLEDDVIMRNVYFTKHIMRLLGTFPNHWSLISVDTFNNPGQNLPESDAMDVDGFPLYSLSRTQGTYWGAHMWLLNSRPLERFVSFYQNSPAVPVDWITKVNRPLHMGIWAFQPRQAFQHDRAPIKKMPECEDRVISMSTIADLHLSSSTMTAALSKEFESAILDQARVPELIKRQVSDDLHAAPHGQHKYRNLHIFGMYHSGAQFVANLFNSTVSAAIAKAECGDPNAAGDESCLKGWKPTLHRIHPQRVTAETFKGEEDGVAVLVVRHPFAAVRSAQRGPEEGLDCGSSNGTDALSHPCFLQESLATVPGQEDMCRAGRLKGGDDPCWESLPSAWNAFSGGFTHLQKIFSKVVEIRFEDLVEFPEQFTTELADAIGVNKRTEECTMDVPTPGVTAGTYFHKSSQKTVRECQNTCTSEPSCESIVFRAETGSCWLLPRPHHDQPWVHMSALSEAGVSTVVSTKVCETIEMSVEMNFKIDKSARETLVLQDYAAHYNGDEMADLCNQINKTRMRLYGYHGCQDVWPGFDELIFHGEDWEDKYSKNLLKGLPNWELMEGRVPARVNRLNLEERVKKMRWHLNHDV